MFGPLFKNKKDKIPNFVTCSIPKEHVSYFQRAGFGTNVMIPDEKKMTNFLIHKGFYPASVYKKKDVQEDAKVLCDGDVYFQMVQNGGFIFFNAKNLHEKSRPVYERFTTGAKKRGFNFEKPLI